MRSFERALRFPESDEERVPLRIDLDATATRHRLSHGSPVLSERTGVARSPKLVQQACRALDVREEEGDSPARQLAHGAPA